MESIPINVAVFEVVFADESVATCRGVSHDGRDHAIQLGYEMIMDQGISGDEVRRVYSEWKPSDEMATFLEKNCPKAAVTWSFEDGDEEEFARAMKKLYYKKWWQFWK